MEDEQNKHSCAIGLCVRNNAYGLPKVFENISKIRPLFKTCIVVSYYDMSNDRSLELLHYLSVNYGIELIVLNADCTGEVSEKRTVNIARARNAIVKYVNTSERCKEFELFAMMDSNHYSCQGNIMPDVIKKYLSTGMYNQWDSLSFARKPYYDLWAYSDGVFQIGCWCYPRQARSVYETTVYQFQYAIKNHLDNTIFAEKNRGKLVEVDSAFCGFAFYKKASFANCVYNGGWSTTYMDRELLTKNLVTFKLLHNGQTDDCEHRHFHMQAKKLNGAKIMIACEQAFGPSPN